MTNLYSYVVRYDSGFAPNPFYGYCTLATCKPKIRNSANVGDWVVGCGSNSQDVRRGGHLVYAMRVSETLNFNQYNADPRFESKKPFRHGSRKQSCGDNIYYSSPEHGVWQQRDSFHSHADGSINGAHVNRDTGTNRILISNQYIYFGGEGPEFPPFLRDRTGRPLCKSGIGYTTFDDPQLIANFEQWINSFGAGGYHGVPFEWLTLRRK